MKEICHSCGGSYKVPFERPRSGEIPGICRLCAGPLREGTTAEEMIDRQRQREGLRDAALRKSVGVSRLECAEIGFGVLVLTGLGAIVWLSIQMCRGSVNLGDSRSAVFLGHCSFGFFTKFGEK
jgi:hypothetical protein